jgi:hypothetical protein
LSRWENSDRVAEADVQSDWWPTELACLLVRETVYESKARLALTYARISGARGPRASLAISGNAGEDQSGISCVQHVRAKAPFL